MTVTIFGAAVSFVFAIGCAMILGGFTDGFVKAFTPTYDREIASRAAMPIPIGLSFRAPQTAVPLQRPLLFPESLELLAPA